MSVGTEDKIMSASKVQLTTQQFLDLLAFSNMIIFSRQHLGNIDGIEDDGILDMIVDIDEFNKTSTSAKIKYELQTSTHRFDDPRRLKRRDVVLKLDAMQPDQALSVDEYSALVNLFNTYIEEEDDIAKLQDEKEVADIVAEMQMQSTKKKIKLEPTS